MTLLIEGKTAARGNFYWLVLFCIFIKLIHLFSGISAFDPHYSVYENVRLLHVCGGAVKRGVQALGI